MGASEILCLAGLFLFLLGLLGGAGIPRMKSPRLGLSAHLTGLEGGTFLIAVGLMWPRLTLSGMLSGVLANGLWISVGLVWLALLLAGVFGAGHGFAIAGQGVTTSAGRQRLVTLLLATGSLGCVAAIAAMLVLWRWRG
jgi:hydroxylaminobenzene mutase